MSEIKQNITNELSEEELENIAGGFGHPTMDDSGILPLIM